VIGAINGLAGAWAESMWRACWQGALAAGVVWLLCVCFKRLHPALRAWLWWLVCLKMLLAFLVSPFSVPVLPAARLQATPLGYSTPPDLPLQQLPQVPQLPPPPPPTPSPDSVALSTWLVGGAVVAGWTVRSLAKTRSEVRRAPVSSDPASIEIAAFLATRYRLRRSPELRESQKTRDVLLFGLVKPKILLPADSWPGFSREEKELVLAHELAHLKRGDVWLGLLPQVAQVFFFFHPAVWLACREYGLARESDCDRIAIQSLNIEPTRFGQLLLKLGVAQDRIRPLTTPGASSHFRTLQRRISMLGKPTFVNSPKVRVVTAAAALAGLLLLAPLRLVEGQSAVKLVTTVSLAKPPTRSRHHKPSTAATHRASGSIVVARLDVKHAALTSDAIAAASQAKPNPSPDLITTRIYNLQYAKAAPSASMLKRLFAKSNLTIDSDDRTNIVVARGTGKELDELAAVLEHLDKNMPAQGDSIEDSETRVYEIKYSDTYPLSRFVRSYFGDDKKLRIFAEPRTNRLILVGSADQLNKAFNLLTILDVPARENANAGGDAEPSAAADQAVHVFQVHNTKAEEVERRLTQNKASLGNGVSFISIDPNTNSLVVNCNESGLQEIVSALRQLDVKGPG